MEVQTSGKSYFRYGKMLRVGVRENNTSSGVNRRRDTDAPLRSESALDMRRLSSLPVCAVRSILTARLRHPILLFHFFLALSYTHTHTHASGIQYTIGRTAPLFRPKLQVLVAVHLKSQMSTRHNCVAPSLRDVFNRQTSHPKWPEIPAPPHTPWPAPR